MILRRRKPQPSRIRRSMIVRSSGHLQYVRGFACAIQGKRGHDCEGKIQACHVRTGTDGGTGMKPGDNWTIPLCAGGHRLQHDIGEAAFERAFGISMKAIAEWLWKRSPHRLKWEKQCQ